MTEEGYKEAAQNVTAWYRSHGRDLPWRRTKDPYAIWVSEIMLQQTQVETVKPYYERFINELPTAADLAEAEEQRVFKLWEGLGYYRIMLAIIFVVIPAASLKSSFLISRSNSVCQSGL